MKTHKMNNSMLVLKGSIAGLKKSRKNHDFVLTSAQHQQMDMTAIVASAMGMGSTAIGLISMAGNADEEADWVEFNLGDNHLQGWLWKMPMQNGDDVEVVAEPIMSGEYIIYAVRRDADGLLAIYPHATAGRNAHYGKSVKVWVWCFGLAYAFVLLLSVMQEGFGIFLEKNMQIVFLGGFFFSSFISGIMAFRISRKFMGFVRIAEKVFSTFGWSDVKSIDLRRTSRENLGENKLGDFGNFYFRYK